MFGSILLRYALNSSMLYWWFCTNVSSTYLHQTDCGLAAMGMARVPMVSMHKLATMGETGDPMPSPYFCLYHCPLYMKYVVLKQKVNSSIIGSTLSEVRCFQLLLSSVFLFTMSIGLALVKLVNRADTS